MATITPQFYNIRSYTRVILPLVLFLGWASWPIYAFQTFGFQLHHRFSDPVNRILDAGQNLPAKGTTGYFAALAHRDLAVHGRRLSSSSGDSQTPLTFSSGNTTYRISLFGFLHYANVTVGTPGLSFLVALDTGSDLFWLPCDCIKCVKGVKYNSDELDFNIYSLNTSSSGTEVPCNSPLCAHKTSCPVSPSTCPYKVMYLSSNTSSSGYLVEDVLHLTADNNPSKPVVAKIPFGCGKVETGSFLSGGAPNGLLGLGLDSVSLPSMLASQNIAANSFSMCFGDDGLGRITFGDKGSSDQSETSFNLRKLNPHYNVSISRINVGTNVSHVDDFYAIFDSGTSFTYLNDPAYSLIGERFDAQVKDSRHTSDSDIPFEYCYDLSSSQSVPNTPPINLTMEGGDHFYVNAPIVPVTTTAGDMYCLGIVKSEDVNIIGQNFMTGYRVVFDREKMVLGWKASDCNEAVESSMLPISPQSTGQVPPISSIEPQAVQQNGSHISGASSALRHNSSHLNLWTCTVIISFLHLLSILW
ncbi:aspartyl protease family protein 1 [Beta vulgaris subsp. vulgaris]|uniref:aspartyl protease family protein 1 n=1 Tax=Beta vulgaris subsp. vulgaris TaxID=3555 RepID=UPI0020366FEE|nr:aspartyl protease family protein 1 [Beta vulgaris subsp. vulgaris]